MAVPYFFSNFPAAQQYCPDDYEFERASDLTPWTFSVSGHAVPTQVDSVDTGQLTLGSGSVTSGAYVAMQKTALTVQPNRLGKTYEFTWIIQLSSATLTQALVGLGTANANPLNTNITNGFGMYANLTNGLSATNWTIFLALASTTQFTTYAQLPGPPVDTSMHTLSILYKTDPTILGAGSMVFFWDTVAGGSMNQLNNGYSSTSAAIFPQVPMGLLQAMGNGSGAAQTMKIGKVTKLATR